MNYNDISTDFETPVIPFKALVFYNKETTSEDAFLYVESYDISECGNPINAHPLTLNEMEDLKHLFVQKQDSLRQFLHSDGLLPANLLFLRTIPDEEKVIWFTEPSEQTLFFVDSLGIPNGQRANVPAMVWEATSDSLSVYALKQPGKPATNTRLYHAPFFNLYKNGAVCMGTVNLEFKKDESIQEFIKKWQNYLWNSRFSHLIDEHIPIKKNIVQLWQNLITTKATFPLSVLKPLNLTFKNILK